MPNRTKKLRIPNFWESNNNFNNNSNNVAVSDTTATTLKDSGRKIGGCGRKSDEFVGN